MLRPNDYKDRLEELTKQSVSLQKWQLVVAIVSIVNPLIALLVGYLTRSQLAFLVIGAALIIVIGMLVFFLFPTQPEEYVWWDKIHGLDGLLNMYDSLGRPSWLGRTLRNTTRTLQGQAIASRRQDLATYFQGILNELDSDLKSRRNDEASSSESSAQAKEKPTGNGNREESKSSLG